MRLPPLSPLLLVFGGGGGAVEAAAGVLPSGLLPLLWVPVLVLPGPHLHVVHVGVRHQVDVAVGADLKAHQYHT